MASNTPSPGDPRPDDRTPPETPPRHESPLGEWLGAEEVGPAPGVGGHDPDPITEQVLFDDLLPLTNPPAPSGPVPTADPVTPPPADADPEDVVADLPLAGPDGSGSADVPLGGVPAPGSSVFGGGFLHTGSDIYRDAPPSGTAQTGPTQAPGSSIFEITPPPVGEGATGEAATGHSDVLSGPLAEGSDVLGQIARPDDGNSNIFDARPEGSGRFEDPGDATEEVTEIRPADPSGEWAADPLRPGSDLFGDPAAAGADPQRPGSGLFEARPDSEVFGARPDSEVFEARPGSGLFEGRPGSGESFEPRPGSEVFEARPGSGESFEPRPESDVFEDRPTSGVFEARPGSGVFDPRPGSDVIEPRPASGVFDPTAEDADADRPRSEVFHPEPEDNPRQPDSDLFAEPPAGADEGWPASAVFGEHPAEGDLLGPDEERRAGDRFEDSGVDLLHPEPDVPADAADEAAGGGSIFDMEKAEGEGSELEALPLPDDQEPTESIHLPTGETGPRSDLFRSPDTGTEDPDRVSFELPDRPAGDAEPSQQVSGLIDWAAPVEGADLDVSAGLSETEATEAGMSDPRGPASGAPTPVNTPGPARRPPSTIPDMNMTERRRPDSRPGSQWMFAEPAPARSSRTGWVVGTAVGLLLGAGGVAGAYFAGLLPSRATDPIRSAASGTQQVPAPAPAPQPAAAAPAALLAAGDPAAALRAYEAAGEVATPEDRAGRGQARFLARLRELAEQGAAPRANDPQLQQASADLSAVVQNAGALETDEQKRAGVLAALHLGLIKELTGDAKGAQADYRAAQRTFPAYRRVFDAALKRERMAPKAAPAGTARLTPQEAAELAQLAVIATVLLQAPQDGTALDDEPGFHFWEACELNAGRQYLKAANAISQAREAHERRRLKLAGRGLNPLSDPLEQMFTRACAEIREYWVLKHHFYGHEQLGSEMRTHAQKGTFDKFLSEVVALRKEAKTGGGQRLAQVQAALDRTARELKTAVAAATKAAAERDAAAREKETATAAAAKSAAEKDAIARDLTAAKQSLDEQTKQLADARKSLDDARARQKTADDALAAVVKQLKASKLIDETDDAAAAVAKLPDVVRKAAAAATSTDAKRAAEALVKAHKDLEAARAETDKAEAVARKAADDAKSLRDQLAAQVKKAADEAQALRDRTDVAVKKATDAATAEARRKLDALSADTRQKLDALSAQLTAARGELARQDAEKADAIQRAEAAFAAKLKAKEEEYLKLIRDARAGVATPLTTAEVAARERASQEYDAGVRLFFAGRYAEAEAMLDRATRDDAADARYWYYLALAQALQGKPTEEALRKGADLEAHGQPGQRAVNAALERLPGSYRQWLSRYRP